MNTRQLIRTELNGLLAVTAETYNDLIPEDISEDQFDTVADTIDEARQTTEDNIIGVTQELVKETVAGVKAAQVKKEKRVSRLLPKDIGLGEPAPAPTGALSEAEALAAATKLAASGEEAVPPVLSPNTTSKPTLEGPQAGLPRDVGAPEMPISSQNLVEATEKAISQGGGMAGGVDVSDVVDMDLSNDDGFSHDLGMTIDQQNRLKAGVPLSRKAPPKAFGHYPKTEEAPVAATSSNHEAALRQIGKLAAKYANADDAAMSMFATSIVTIAEEALNENFS